MGVVKARVQMDLLVPEDEAATLEKSSLERIMSRIEHGPWLAGPVTVSAPVILTAPALRAELAAMEAAGCSFDEDDVASLKGAPGWYDAVGSLEDMIRLRDRFLSDPGCQFDMEGIREEVDPNGNLFDATDGDLVIQQEYFSKLVSRFLFKDTFTVHRHVTVEDVEGFARDVREAASPEAVGQLVEAAEDMAGGSGGHWSLDPATDCPDLGGPGEEAMLRGEVSRESVDWYSTFQAAFSRPHEMELSLGATPRLTRVVDLSSEAEYDMDETSSPAPGR